MPLSVYRKLSLREVRLAIVLLLLADQSIKHPKGIIEDVLVKVDKFIFPTDLIVLDMEEDQGIPIITGRTLIDVQKEKLALRVQDHQVSVDIFKVPSFLNEKNSCYRVDIVTGCTRDIVDEICLDQSLAVGMINSLHSVNLEILKQISCLEANSPIFIKKPFEDLREILSKPILSIEKPPVFELKTLQSYVKYAYLGEDFTLLMIISSALTLVEEDKMLRILSKYKIVLGWLIANIKGISPSICMYKILIEDNLNHLSSIKGDSIQT